MGGEDREAREGREEAGADSAQIDVLGSLFGHGWQRCCAERRSVVKAETVLTRPGHSLIPQQLCASNAVCYKSLTSRQSLIQSRGFFGSAVRSVGRQGRTRAKEALQKASALVRGAPWGRTADEDVGSSCGCQELCDCAAQRGKSPCSLHPVHILGFLFRYSLKRCKAVCVLADMTAL